MSQLIVIAGAPGSGKTTICKLLHEHFQSVYIDFGWLREFHLDIEWRKSNILEETMSFENLLFIIKNYFKHNYDYVLVTDLQDHRVEQIPHFFALHQFLIVTLIIHDDVELQRRVVDPTRDSGYHDYHKSLAWNHAVITRPLLPNEYKFDNTSLTPEEASYQIIKLISNNSHSS
jgi:chloramphenicol 3-O-phosphotransferase